MKIKLQKLVTAIVILGSFAALISNTVTFRAYVIQNQSVSDQNKIIPEMTIEEAIKNDLNYPNINIYTVPFKTHLGRVYLRDSFYEKAINNFHRARKANPYLLINENYLAETYLTLGKRDSFKFYAKKIFKNAPNHPNHFAFYIKSLDTLKNTYKIDSAFNTIKFKTRSIWKVYLSAIYNIDDKLDLAKKNLQKADSIYPNEKEIQYLIDANNYGQDQLKKSDEYVALADELAKNEDFNGSIQVLKEALKLFPTSNSIFDKIATSYFKTEQFDSSLYFISKINLNKYSNPGRYYLVRGINHVKLGKIEKGCKDIYQSILLGNKSAIAANKSFCN
jgi:predicted Zn-dependent protease